MTTTTTRKAAAKAAAKPEPRPDPLPLLQAWADARDHIRIIDAQTGADASLPARDAERLQEDRAALVAAQEAVEKALA